MSVRVRNQVKNKDGGLFTNKPKLSITSRLYIFMYYDRAITRPLITEKCKYKQSGFTRLSKKRTEFGIFTKKLRQSI